MAAKEVKFGSEARNKMLAGVDLRDGLPVTLAEGEALRLTVRLSEAAGARPGR